MREIKFRGFNGKRMLFMGVGECDFELRGGAIFEFDSCGYDSSKKDYPLMQYTGLKDKNGKEIYESDLLAFDAKEWYRPFCSGETDYIFLVSQADTGEWMGAGICTEWPTFCKVIGNIHTDPELLNN